jgi:murein DD-endopeptidase MepM/ murein hydrolase activator NlpD
MRLRFLRLYLPLVLLLGASLACARSQQSGGFWSISSRSMPTAVVVAAQATQFPWAPHRTPGAPILTPTPDAPHVLPALRTNAEQYSVRPGDTLGQIANRYGISIEQIVQANELADPNVLEVGQQLTIPVPTPQSRGPDFKIIPDSELVYGPYSVLFDVEAFVQKQGGFLAAYREEVDDQPLSGAQIVKRIAQDYSVNPRLLLALLQQQSGWVTNPNPARADQQYPLGLPDPQRKGLYRQLAWAANGLNRGYYLWRANGVNSWILADDTIVPADPTINAGTAGIQAMYAAMYDRATWEKAVSSDGLFAAYNALFGYPFDYALEPLLPDDLFQPTMQLPFEAGSMWYYTGGPHGGWGDGSAWAALDFAPPGEAVGCVESNAWVTAVADGLILRAENGAVIQDLDDDGLEQTGWVVLYMHVEARDRVRPGVFLKAGEKIGHPSCEGGVSSGTHVHVARRYNGEWIPADQDIPFVMDGWLPSGLGAEYDGYLNRGGQKIEAYAGIAPNNGIQR